MLGTGRLQRPRGAVAALPLSTAATRLARSGILSPSDAAHASAYFVCDLAADAERHLGRRLLGHLDAALVGDTLRPQQRPVDADPARRRIREHALNQLSHLFVQLLEGRILLDVESAPDVGRKVQLIARHEIVKLVRQTAGKQLIKHHPRGPHVALVRGPVAGPDLWGDVPKRACDACVAARAAAEDGVAEIRDLHVAILGVLAIAEEEDVLWTDVEVRVALAGNLGQAAEELDG
mmetsp:Transcript_90177/g.176567  ORF Transcript_90177/g.176567 Transcript_90177/m.176567 type:complete len:235 (-) Transcript_90177:543-1247(-)